MPLEMGKVPLGGAQLCLGVADLAMLGPDAFDDPRPHQRRGREPDGLGQSLHLGYLLWVEADRIDEGACSVRSAERGTVEDGGVRVGIGGFGSLGDQSLNVGAHGDSSLLMSVVLGLQNRGDRALVTKLVDDCLSL